MNSIIVPTYCPTPDVAKLLARCLHSLFLNSAEPYELVIVEQGTGYFKNFLPAKGTGPSGGIVYDYEHEPIGYAAAVNRGISMAVGDHLFVVNNDIEVPPFWDKNLLQVYREDPRMGLLSPVDRDGTVGVFEESWWSCVLIYRIVWNAVGPLDERELNYRLHDQDWSIRCTKAGFKVRRFSGVRVQHQEASTYRHMRIDESNERAVMRARYGHEHFFQWVQAGKP